MADVNNLPHIIEFEYFFFKLQNKSKSHCENLIDDKYLKNIEKSFQNVENLLNSISFNLPGKTKRYLLWSNYLNHTSYIRKAMGEIETQVYDLKQNWGELLIDAQSRLGDLYEKTEYPDPKQLNKIFGFKIDFHYECGILTTLEIYKEYSLHHVIPPGPPATDICEAALWAREQLEKKQKKEKED